MANEIYNSSDWGNGVCDNAIDWGVVYKDFAGCTPSFTNTFSLAFDGVDDFLDTGAIDLGETNTISFWFKNNSANTGNAIIGDANDNVVYFQSSNLFYYPTGSITGRKLFSSTNIASAMSDTTNWHNIIFIRKAPTNGTNGYNDLACYLDGNLEGTFADVYTANINLIPVYIGKSGTGFPLYDGNIDEVSYYNNDQTANVSTISTSPVVDLTSLNPSAWYRNGDNGSYKSPQWLIPNNSNKDKVSNYSFEFDGVDDKITFSDITTSGDFTVSFWAKPTAFNTNGSSFIFGTESGNSNLFKFVSATRVQMKIVALSGSTNTFTDTTGSNNVVLDEWQNFIATRDSSGNFIMYRNGVQFGSTLTNANTLTINSIGRVISSSIGYAGGVDEFAYWDSVQNVASIYNSGTPTTITGAVAHWKMGEEANFTDNWLVNNSALSNYSTRSFNFDGVDDYMTVATPTTLTDFTTSVWIHRTGNGNFDGIFGQDSSTAKGGILRYVSLDGTNITLYLTSGWTAMSGALAIDTWHHFALTYDSTANELKSYINGSLYTTISSPDFSGQSTDAHSFSRIGMRNGNTATSFPGLLDEIALWNTAKSASDISAIYNSAEPTTITGAIAHWRMGEQATFSTNWSIPDQVGSSTVASVNMTIADLEGNAPNYTGGGLSANMTIEDRVGDAPNSNNNSLSYNMTESDRVENTPS